MSIWKTKWTKKCLAKATGLKQKGAGGGWGGGGGGEDVGGHEKNCSSPSRERETDIL